MAGRVLWNRVETGQFDDALATFYQRDLGSAPGHIQYTGTVTRTGISFLAGASGLNLSVKSIHVRFRKYGSPVGNIVCGIRKASDGTLVTLGTYPIESFPAGVEQTLIVRLRSNSYLMLTSDRVSIEFPASATDGLEISTNTTDGPVTNYQSQQWTGSWANTSNPISITVKG
jgi:hypothetical protein